MIELSASGGGSLHTPCNGSENDVRTVYELSVYLHLLAVTVWFGGMAFLVLVIVPELKRKDRNGVAELLRATGERFRTVGWICLFTLLATGTINLWARGVRLGDFLRPEWLGSPFGKAVVLKLCLFAIVVAISAVHDFRIGPRAVRAIRDRPDSLEASQLRRLAARLGRANALLALLMIAVGVVLVRGMPW
jgi:putative copper resistance protein D